MRPTSCTSILAPSEPGAGSEPVRKRGCQVAALLMAVTACARAPDVPQSSPARGAQLFLQNCVPCHREDGRGVSGVYPSLAGSPVVNGDPLDLARWVLNGERPVSMPSGRYSTQMLMFAWMKDADAALLLTHVRSSFGNQAAAVDDATILRARGGESR